MEPIYWTSAALRERRRTHLALALVAIAAAAAGLGAGFWVFSAERPRPAPSVVVVRPTPNILVAVQELARLETTSFHIERVIDLTEKQQRLFGLLESEDAILLVAAGDVTAGVDLGELRPGDVAADPQARTVKIALPPPRVFSTRLDNERTYVHTRKTGILARRQENLETRARQEAERSIGEAAAEGGILDRARGPASRTVEMLLRSLGYERVQIDFRAE